MEHRRPPVGADETCFHRSRRTEWFNNNPLEHFTLVEMLGKDFPANPCREIGAGELCSSSSDYFKH
jgi:hypothetical protein